MTKPNKYHEFTPAQLRAFCIDDGNTALFADLDVSAERLSEWEHMHTELQQHGSCTMTLWRMTILRHTADDNERSTLWAYRWGDPDRRDAPDSSDLVRPSPVDMHPGSCILYTTQGRPGDTIEALACRSPKELTLIKEP